MQSNSKWIICKSTSFPGSLYYFDVRTGKAVWSSGDAKAKITAGRPPETLKETESNNHSERKTPPAPDPLQHDYFTNSIQQTPETRREVTPFSCIRQNQKIRHEVTPFGPIHQNPETRHMVTPFSSIRQTMDSQHEVTPFSCMRQNPEIRHEDTPFSSVRQTTVTSHEVTPISFIPQTPDPKHEVTPCNSIPKTPETRHDAIPSSSIHHPTASPIKQNFLSSMRHPTSVFGQKTFPRGLLNHEDSNVMWTPVQIQAQIPLQNQASPGDEYPVYRDHPNISDADRSQVSHSMEGLKYIVTQSLSDTKCQEILVNASTVPMHQRFVNFEAPGITFSTVNKDNIKRLNQKLKSTPLKKSETLQDPRLVNKPRVFESKSHHFQTHAPDFKPKTGNSIIKESVLNFGLFSNTNQQDLSCVLPTKIQEQRNQSFNIGPPITTPEPVFNGRLTKSREPPLSNKLPSKSMKTSLNFDPPLKTKEPFVILPPNFNDGTHSKTIETVFNFDLSQKTKDPFSNLGAKTQEPSEQYVNVGPAIKTKEPVLNRLSLQTNEPVFNGQALKAKDPVINGLPSELPDEAILKEPKSVLKGCLKSLNSGDNAVVKSFDEELRAVLASKRKCEDLSNTEYQGLEPEPKISKQETPVKKEVTFNLDHESISMCAFVELHMPTVSYLKALGPSSSQESWFILADAEVLTEDFKFIRDFVQIDPTCNLLIPPVVQSSLLALARGDDRKLATAARNVLRRTTSSHVVDQPCKVKDNPTCTCDAILRCCLEKMEQKKHLVLMSNDVELLTTVKCYPIPCYTLNSIRNGLPAKKQLQYENDIKIQIRYDTADIKIVSAVKKSSNDDDLNEKEKAISKNLQISKYPIEKETSQNEQNDNPNGNIQNGQIGTGPNDKKQNPIKYFYHNKITRIATRDAMEVTRTEFDNITAAVDSSAPTDGTHDGSNTSTIQNESTDIKKKIQSMVIDKSIESINKEHSEVKKTAEARWRFKNEITKTSIEDDIQKLNIKDIDKTKSLKTDKTVSVFFKNQKPFDLVEKFKYMSKKKISLNNNKSPEILTENNKLKETEKENQELRLKNKVPRLEMRKSNDSILEFCKEKTKEPPTAEFENGKTVLASQCQITMFEFKNGKTYIASQYDTTKFEYQNGKTNMSSQLDRSKSFDVSKPQTMKNRIDLMRFYVKSKDVQYRLKARMDEWVCFYTQIMEESLSTVLQNQSPAALSSAPPPPWSLLELLQTVDTVYEQDTYVTKIIGHLCSCLYESRSKMKKFILPEEFMRALGCGAKLLEYLEMILPSIIEIQDGVTALLALLDQIEDDTDPTIGLSEPAIPAAFNSETDSLDVRHNFVKDRSQITDYLQKHFAVWRDYVPGEEIKVVRTRSKNGIKLEKSKKRKNVKNLETINRNGNVSKVDLAHSAPKNSKVGKYSCDKFHVNDMNLFGLDGNQFGVKEFETKLRKRNAKPVYVDIKPVKKPKIDVKTASKDKAYNDTDKKYAKNNGNPKNTVYRQEEDPKLIYSPRVIIKPIRISDYEEKMTLKKAKKLYYSDETEDNDNHSSKTDKQRDKYNLISYNDNNNYHTVTKNSDNSNRNNNQITKIKNKKNNHENCYNDNHNDDNNNHKDNNDDNNNKDVNTDSGLGKELPRWADVVDSCTADIENSLTIILRDMNSEQLGSFRDDSLPETCRMRAFEIDYLVCRTLSMLRSLLHQAADEDDRARNIEAVAKYMAQAKSIHEVVNSILSAKNYL